MAEEVNRLEEVWSLKRAIEEVDRWGHLYEVLVPPAGFQGFRERDGFETGGTLMVGDLVLVETKARVLETHPFPEWVLQSRRVDAESAPAYLVLPKLPRKVVERRLVRKPYEVRVAATKKALAGLGPGDLFAIEYEEGACVKVGANVPHYFLAPEAPATPGSAPPYLLVFEPKVPFFTEALASTTPYYDLGFQFAV
ncbi:MAG: hypothetical protein Kow0069_36180 [Promethearchaeota archaeon]